MMLTLSLENVTELVREAIYVYVHELVLYVENAFNQLPVWEVRSFMKRCEVGWLILKFFGLGFVAVEEIKFIKII